MSLPGEVAGARVGAQAHAVEVHEDVRDAPGGLGAYGDAHAGSHGAVTHCYVSGLEPSQRDFLVSS